MMLKKLILIFLPLLVILTGCSVGDDDYNQQIVDQKVRLHYNSTVTKDDAQKLLDYLMKKELKGDHSIDIRFSKKENTNEIRVIIKKGLETDPETIQSFALMAGRISAVVFNNDEVDIHLCDEEFNTLRVVLQIN